MKTFFCISICSLLAVFLLSGCASESTKSAETKPQTNTNPTAPAPAPVKPETYLYTTVYDAMLLRAEADQKAAVIEKLALGTLLEGNNEKSAQKVEATLGGVTWTEPFYSVSQVGGAAKSGWIFGGGIQTIYAGPKAGAPDLVRLTRFAELLKTLKVNNLESGKVAWDYVRANFSDAQGATADAALVMLERFGRRLVAEGNFYSSLEKINWSEADFSAIWEGKYDMSKKPLDQKFDAAGLCYFTGEGMVYPIWDMRKLQSFFGSKCTPAMKTFLDMEVHAQLKPETTDAHLIITPEELADRCAAWQKFNQAHPYFVYADQTKESARWTHLMLVNNRDVFDADNGSLLPEGKKAWDYILQKYTDQPLGQDIKALRDLVAAEGNKKTPKVEAWMEAFATRMEL